MITMSKHCPLANKDCSSSCSYEMYKNNHCMIVILAKKGIKVTEKNNQ